MDDPPSAPDADSGLNGFGRQRRSTVRFVLSLAVALAVALLLRVSQPAWFSLPATATNGQSGRVIPRPTPTPRPRVEAPSYPSIGGARAADRIRITLVGVKYTHGSGANQANTRDVYAVVTLRIENIGAQDYGFVPNTNCVLQTTCNFYVRDNQGEKNPPVAYDPYHTGLRPVVLAPGGAQEGSYTFEVPARDVADQTLQLLWYHDPLGDANGVAHWLLKDRSRHGR